MTGTCLLSPHDDLDDDERDIPELILLDYIAFMQAHGITPSGQIAFAAETILAAAAGAFEPQKH